MASELLLEVPSEVRKVFAMAQTAGAVHNKSPLVIVQADSIAVVHVSLM
jgi:hypothetical protein